MGHINKSHESVEVIRSLVRPPAFIDKIGGQYTSPDSLKIRRIIGFHGTRLSDIEHLAAEGSYRGSVAGLSDAFHLVPNISMRGWEKTYLANAKTDALLEDIDPFALAADHAESCDIRELRAKKRHKFADTVPTDVGVVIAFTKAILQELKCEIRPGTCSEDDETPELVLNGAPSISTIEGIYPLGRKSADELEYRLGRLSMAA